MGPIPLARVALLAAALLLAGCTDAPAATPQAPPEAPASPLPSPAPTPQAPPETPAPPLPSPTPTAAPSRAPPPAKEPPREAGVARDVAFEVEDAVAAADRVSIEAGVARAQRYLEERLGLAFPSEGTPARVVVVAWGRGDAPEGASGPCCTAQENEPPFGARVFIDTLHPHWPAQVGPSGREVTHQKIAAHELMHAWQASAGCGGGALGAWLTEGTAEFLAWDAMIADGLAERDAVRAHALEAAKTSRQLEVPLSELETQEAGIWPGDVGYLVVDRLVDELAGDAAAIARLCGLRGAGADPPAAFEEAFGVALDELYEREEARRSAPAAP